MNLIDPPCPRFSFANAGRGLAFLAALLLAGCAGIGERKTGEPPGVAAESAGVRTLANPPLCGGGGQPDCLIVKIIDIGQGSTAFVRLPDGTSMLFDAGGSGAGNAVEVNAQINALLPVGDNIDYLVLSHSDNDHTNLLNRIDRLVPTSLVAIHLSGEPGDYDSIQGRRFFGTIYTDPTVQRTIPQCNQDLQPGIGATIYCYANDTAGASAQPAGFPNDPAIDLYTYLLAVNVGSNTTPPTSSNEGSLVAGINYGGFSVMFPGDAEGTTQTFIQAHTPANLWQDTQVYPMAHHGSGTNGSNAVSWLQAIQPRVYITSSARHVGWYHPQGSLIHAIRTDAVLSPRLYNWTNHHVFSSAPGHAPAYCYCTFPQSMLSTYTNGTITILADHGGNYQVSWAANTANGLPACPVPNANYC